MPRQDKTGPLGNGSMTGRKMGDCYNQTKKFDTFKSDQQSNNIYLEILNEIKSIKNQLSILENKINNIIDQNQ